MTDQRKALKIIKKLQRKGFQAVFAGGCVRDMLLNKEPHDFDVATSATPDQVEKIFVRNSKTVGKAFGVVLVKVNGTDFEVATFRKDGTYSDGRRPDSVEFVPSMKDDADRRDFTVNAMFWDPVKRTTWDFVDGQRDLTMKKIRFVGDPKKRIEEDKLRLLRAVRFCLKLDFWMDSDTAIAVRLNANKLNTVSPERIRDELMKMLAAGRPRKMMDLLFSTHLVDYVLPELRNLDGCRQNSAFHPEGDVLEHTVQVMEGLVNEPVLLQLAGMLHDIGKPATMTEEDGQITNRGHDVVGASMVEEIMTRLKFSNDEIEYVKNLTADHMQHHFVRSMRKSTLKRYMALPYFDDLTKLNRADINAASKNFSALEYIEEKRKSWKPEEIKPKSLITGKDLIEAGFTPGPMFKTILSFIEEGQLEGKIRTREDAMKIVKNKRWGA